MDKTTRSIAIKTLVILASIAGGALLLPNVLGIAIFLWAMLWIKPNTDDKIPLLNAMLTETRQSSNPTWAASNAVLKFIPIGTTKAKALTLLTQNKFEYQISPSGKSKEIVVGRLHSNGLPCARDYIIVIEIKNEHIQDVKAEAHDICL